MQGEGFDNNVRLGMVGLGIMGTPIVERLRDKGYALTVWNLEPERFDKVKDSGAEWAESPEEVWQSSDVVLVCVLGDDAIESVCFGPDGFARAGEGAKVLIDLSTTSPEATLKLAARLKEELGADWIDAPMSGGPQPAREGQLTLMAGGDEACFAAVEPILRDIGQNVTCMGEIGNGQKTKILNQAIVGTNYILMAELLAACRATGIDPDLLPVCLKGGLADSAMLQRIYTQMSADDFDPPRSYVRQVNKDLKAVSHFVEDLGLELPLLDAAVRQYGRYADAGNDMEDSASVSRLYQTQSS
ncbi:NAD(P)-dependent oxidoreductase [Pelagibacterium lentulum]|uniref:3-hydroxyisobutyrate dehydrogenase n=1 Tax=Pelagibacterium lentulum TaxID=2029865 RepID=A0A916VXA0_9HYPH|nr:NAD(P)-dependent oxidoreductase [Pelagibacterium lentulum]GGA50112.1 3-hydroxyisobutyrate dehydrogenase [Pelagibacterium lentulum]